jgi:AmiR/NasT family two-component response regulator
MGERLHEALRVLVADEDTEALGSLARILRDLGHEVTARAVSVTEATAEILEQQPDVAIVKLDEDRDHALDLIDEIVEEGAGPVVAVANDADPEFVARAAERGIYAHVQLENTDALRGALEVAVRRHAELEQVSEAVDQLEGALERRVVIERAKGIVMERHSVSEREAFEMLRSHARSSNLKVLDLARSIAEGHAMLPSRG